MKRGNAIIHNKMGLKLINQKNHYTETKMQFKTQFSNENYEKYITILPITLSQ